MARHYCWPLLAFFLLPLVLAKRGSLPLDLRQDVSHRDPKMMYLPFIKVVIPQDPCGTETNGVRDGTCLARGKCDKTPGGQRAGDCSKGFGECCRLSANCTADLSRVEVTQYVTTLKTPEPPTAACTFKIRKRPDVCQIRLDFKTATFAPANQEGVCMEDWLSISNSVTVVDGFTLCGDLRDQHMYLSFGGQDSIDITPRIMANGRYEIVVTQIPCLSRRIVPSYCLQYFNKTTDTVRSFGYPVQQQNNQRYTVCVEAPESSQRVTWRTCAGGTGVIPIPGSPNAFRPFHITTDVIGDNSGVVCNTDYVDINGDQRYCGDTFSTVVSAWKPYLLNVNFDAREVPDPPFCVIPGFIGTAGACADVQASCGNILTCTWNPLGPAPGDCQCLPNQALLASGIDISTLFGPQPDVGNTGFCLTYET